MPKASRLNIALTIAGSDSGGGAGIQADLKTFAALGVHGTTAITCVTAQNPRRVLDVHACPPAIVRRQLEAVFAELPPDAVKTGLLPSAGIIQTIADFFKGRRRLPLVVDPVMVASSGACFLNSSTVRRLETQLLPLATLVTPNLAEAAVLTHRQLRSVEDLRWAAREIRQRFGCATVVKGGHLHGLRESADVFFDGKTELLLTAPFIKGMSTHGTGCTFSAAITAYLALGCELPDAVIQAKDFITRAIAESANIGRHTVLNPFHRLG